MHDSFNPQVGNFQPALLGNFQPVLTRHKIFAGKQVIFNNNFPGYAQGR